MARKTELDKVWESLTLEEQRDLRRRLYDHDDSYRIPFASDSDEERRRKKLAARFLAERR